MIVGGWIYSKVYLRLPEFILLSFRRAWYLLPISGLGIVISGFKNIKLNLLRNFYND
jgi:PTS system mannose-specific IIC component